MSGPSDIAAGDDHPPPETALPRNALPKALVSVLVGVVIIFALVLFGARYGVLLPQTRLLIEARTDGLKIGRFGKLKIEGLSGDVWRDLGVRRLTIRDEKGVWLEANNVHVAWRSGELLSRRFHAQQITAQQIRVLRRPTLTPKGKSSDLPVSFVIDDARGRLEMLPAFSYQRGVYDLALKLNIQRRKRGDTVALRAVSVLHRGDHLNLDYDRGPGRPLRVVADGEEAQGGALAGALGLPANLPFDLKIQAGGELSQGRFTAVAQSGAVRPLDAAGAWTKDTGQASGRLLLGASTLTQAYARRFGPEAAFSVSGRRLGPNLFALRGQVDAANLKLAVRGTGDVGQRRAGPEGLAVEASAGDLSRIIGGPHVGPTRLSGRLTGGGLDWRLAGEGTATRAELWGYTLGRASGPVEFSLRRGVVTIRGQLAGAGGAGDSWFAGVMGPTARGRFELSRLADGRWTFNDLLIQSRGVDVRGEGGRSLFGALTFKGKARMFNLASARLGAAGEITGGWTATQTAENRPWLFTVSGEGRKFATGFPELDRLFGAAPKGVIKASYLNERVTVSDARLNGAALDAAASGTMGPNNALGFKIDWSASGPFRAGPLEIAGKAKGTGALTGVVDAPKVDLVADLAQIDLPRLPLRDARLLLTFEKRADGTNGTIAVAAASDYGPARGKADFRFPAGGVDLTNLSLDAGGVQAAGSLALRRGQPSAADLQVALARGALLDGGALAGRVRIVGAPGLEGGARATLNLAGENVRFKGAPVDVAVLRLAADGPLARLPYSAHVLGQSGAGAWLFDGSGLFSQGVGGRYAVSFDGTGRLGERNLRTTQTAVFRFGGGEQSARVRLAASDGGGVDLDAQLTSAATSIQASLSGIGLGLVNRDLAGQFDANVSVQGRGDQLSGQMTAQLRGARGRGAPAASGIDGQVRARLAGDQLAVDADATNGQGLRSTLNVVLPAEASAAPFRIAIANRRPIQGRFAAEGEVRPLFDLLVGGERSLSGQVRTSGTLSGTLAQPSANGQIVVENGRFEDGATGLSLRQVALQASFDRDTVDVTQASGVDGAGGMISGQGRISLLPSGVSGFRLNLRNFRLVDNEQATASASGQATIARAANGKVTLSGDLTIDRADVAAKLPTPSNVVAMDVVEKNRPATLPAQLPPADRRRGQGWSLDVNLRAPQRVFLKGRGLDVELSLDAHVGGTTTNPDLSGAARIVRGDYQFAGRRFQFDEESVVHLSTRPAGVRLDLTATREDPSLTAIVRIRGTAERPEVTFTSSPSLPNDEVLSQVLFGRSASQLSPIEAAQLASALSSLSRDGGFDVIGNLRSFARLDRLAFGGDQGSGTTVSGGKYLTDDVYLEVTGGGREGPSAEVEWRVRRNISILSRIAGQNGARLSVRWRKDY